MNVVELIFFLLVCCFSFEIGRWAFFYVGWIGAIVVVPNVFVFCFMFLKMLVTFFMRRRKAQSKKSH